MAMKGCDRGNEGRSERPGGVRMQIGRQSSAARPCSMTPGSLLIDQLIDEICNLDWGKMRDKPILCFPGKRVGEKCMR